MIRIYRPWPMHMNWAIVWRLFFSVAVLVLLPGCDRVIVIDSAVAENPASDQDDPANQPGNANGDLSHLFGGLFTVDENSLPRSGYEQCSAEDMRWMALEVAKDRYLFADQLPSDVNIEDYASTDEMLKAIRFQPKDRFSYAITGKEYEDTNVNGVYEGFGFNWRFDAESETYIFTMIQDGPVRAAGIDRGHRLVSVNGRNSVAIKALYDAQKSSEIWQNPDGSVQSEFQWLDARQQIHTARLTPEEVSLITTHHYSLLTNTPTKTGYLSFQRFRYYDEETLDAALKYFSDENVSELVVDLRYNPGGYVSLARKLASSMLSESAAGLDLLYASYFKKAHVFESPYMNDHTTTVEEVTSPLALSRVYVLTTSSSCSASELFINSLKPYIQVIQIGTATCGKPFGSHPVPYCYGQTEHNGERWSILNFEMLNANRAGEYYQGITPECQVVEGDILPWGDQNDTLLAAAIHHLTTGTCPALPQANARFAAKELNDARRQIDYRAEDVLIDYY